MVNRILLGLSPAKKAALAVAALTVLAVPVLVGIAHAESATPKYEVASIRPSRDCLNGPIAMPGGMSAMPKGAPPPPLPPRSPAITSTGRLSECHTLADLIHEGGPAWVRSDEYRARCRHRNAARSGSAGDTRRTLSAQATSHNLKDRRKRRCQARPPAAT
jgi:hypothetical protein